MPNFLVYINLLLGLFLGFLFAFPANGQTELCEIFPGLNDEYGLPSPVNLRMFGAGNTNALAEYGSFYKCTGESGARIQVHLVSIDDPNSGWDLELILDSGTDWANWSNQGFPTSYVDDFGIVIDEYLDWTYYIITSGTLTGWGAWEESQLSVNHAPANYYYAMEVGIKANGHNSGFGARVWMTHEGTVYNPDFQMVTENASVGSSLYLDLAESIIVDEYFDLPSITDVTVTFCLLEDFQYDEIIPSENNNISIEQIGGCEASFYLEVDEPMVISNLSIGTNVFVISNEDLCGNYEEETVTITVTACPGEEIECSPFTAGLDKLFIDCGGVNETLLQADLSCALTGTWQLFSGGGSFSDATNPSAIYTPSLGINTLVWNAFCNGTLLSDTVEIELVESELYPMSTGANISVYLCSNLPFGLSGNPLPEIASPFWVQDSGPLISFSNSFDPNAQVVFTEPGEYVFRWQYADPCGNYMFSTQTIEVIEDLLAVPLLCNSMTTLDEVPLFYEISGLYLGEAYTGEWTIESESILIIENPDIPETSVSGLTYGTHVFNWEIFNPFCLTSLLCSDSLVITNPSLSGCTVTSALNYSALAIEDDGSCEFDFEICDCHGINSSPYAMLQLGDGIPNQGAALDFNCETWGYDCGDIEGSPTLDPFGVCLGNVPPEAGCICNSEDLSLSLGESYVLSDTALVDSEVCYNTVNVLPVFSGGCYLEDLCFRLDGNDFVCLNLPSMGSFYFSGEEIPFETTAAAQWMTFYFTTELMASDTLAIYVPACTMGTAELKTNFFLVFPNPANNQLTIHSEEYTNTGVGVIISDPLGSIVYEEFLVFREDLTISLSNLPNGIYMVSISDKKHLLQRQKIIIHH